MYLKLSLETIVQLPSKSGLQLKLELTQEDEVGGFLQSITCCHNPPSREDEAKLAESRRIIEDYRGHCSYHASMLVEAR